MAASPSSSLLYKCSEIIPASCDVVSEFLAVGIKWKGYNKELPYTICRMSAPRNTTSSTRDKASSPRGTQVQHTQTGHSPQSTIPTSATSAQNQECTANTTTTGNPSTSSNRPERSGQQIQFVGNPRNPPERSGQRIQSIGHSNSAYDFPNPASSNEASPTSPSSPSSNETSDETSNETPSDETYASFYESNPPKTNRRERRIENQSLSAGAVYMIDRRTGRPTLTTSGHIDPRNIWGFEESEDEGGEEGAACEEGEGREG
ncbi:hypothetical protein BDV97DRAFT_395172 [Delphinella strobiligena]|nr:hypothetical protein BDV97DRAFT_395172 [Delphinella strobiligena]